VTFCGVARDVTEAWDELANDVGGLEPPPEDPPQEITLTMKKAKTLWSKIILFIT